MYARLRFYTAIIFFCGVRPAFLQGVIRAVLQSAFKPAESLFRCKHKAVEIESRVYVAVYDLEHNYVFTRFKFYLRELNHLKFRPFRRGECGNYSFRRYFCAVKSNLHCIRKFKNGAALAHRRKESCQSTVFAAVNPERERCPHVGVERADFISGRGRGCLASVGRHMAGAVSYVSGV